MTGIKMPEKTEAYSVQPYPEADNPVRGERKRFVLIGAIASLSTALVLGAIFCGVIYYLQQHYATRNEEWISWTRRTGTVNVHESVLINEDEQTILMVSAEAYRINEQNSMALHDFKLSYVALRDFKEDICLVTNVKNPDFEAVKKMLESRQGKQLDLQPLEHGVVETRNMTASELGPKLSQFCDGVPAYWFDVTPETGIAKRQAVVGVGVGVDVEAKMTMSAAVTLACIHIRVTVEVTVTLYVG